MTEPGPNKIILFMLAIMFAHFFLDNDPFKEMKNESLSDNSRQLRAKMPIINDPADETGNATSNANQTAGQDLALVAEVRSGLDFVAVLAGLKDSLKSPTGDDNTNIKSPLKLNTECPFVPKSTKPPTTTVVVTSNLIPTMPSTDILEDTLDSLSMIIGLEDNTPIIIAVDGLDAENGKDTPENRKRLQEWITKVRSMFKCHPNVQILTSLVHLHISNTLRMAIGQVTTEFVYIMEHDFPFLKEVDHPLLVKGLREVPQLEIVRFSKRQNSDTQDRVPCSSYHNVTYAGMDFPFAKWSNNNHFTTKVYYDWLLKEIGTAKRPPESKFMFLQAATNCTLYGQHLYGLHQDDGHYLHHIDGKIAAYNRTFEYNNDAKCPKSIAEEPSSVLPWVRCPSYLQ